jgi:hypothetical protein
MIPERGGQTRPPLFIPSPKGFDMKKIIFSVVIVLAIASQALAGEKQGLRTVFSSQAVAGSGTATSAAITVDGSTGTFGYFLQVAGAGSAVKLEVLVGLTEGGTFYQPGKLAADNVLADSFGPASGRNSDGIQVHYFDIPVPLFPFIKIKATELNGQPATVTFKVNVN